MYVIHAVDSCANKSTSCEACWSFTTHDGHDTFFCACVSPCIHPRDRSSTPLLCAVFVCSKRRTPPLPTQRSRSGPSFLTGAIRAIGVTPSFLACHARACFSSARCKGLLPARRMSFSRSRICVCVCGSSSRRRPAQRMYTRTLRFHPCRTPRVVMRIGVVYRPSRRRSPPNKRPRRQRYVTECV